MPKRASRTKDWCKPMATVALPTSERKTEPPVKNLCERSGSQREPQLHSRSQEQILHLILAKRPRRYVCPCPAPLQLVRPPLPTYGSQQYHPNLQFIFIREPRQFHTSPIYYATLPILFAYAVGFFIESNDAVLFQHIFDWQQIHHPSACSFHKHNKDFASQLSYANKGTCLRDGFEGLVWQELRDGDGN